ERRGFTGNGREVRLGQRTNDAGALHRAQRGGDVLEAAGDRSVAQRLPGGGERIDGVEVHHRGPVIEAAGQIDAELLDHVALHLGDRDLEHDLIASAYHDAVDDLGAVADQPRRDVIGFLGLGLARGAARQHNAVGADAFDVNVGIRHDALERGAHAVEVAGDGDVETGDLAALRVEEEDVGLPDRHADYVDAARGAHHGIGDLGVGDQNVLDVGRQVDRHRLADAERDEARVGVARGHVQHRYARIQHRYARIG